MKSLIDDVCRYNSWNQSLSLGKICSSDNTMYHFVRVCMYVYTYMYM